MKMRTVTAHMDNLEEIMDMIEQILKGTGCQEKDKNQVLISVEEIFTNIVSYAYPEVADGKPYNKKIEITCEISGKDNTRTLRIQFRDWGIPYNPLKHPEPDFEIPFEERGIGGLGIHMIRTFMDQVEYKYEDECNQFMIQKVL